MLSAIPSGISPTQTIWPSFTSFLQLLIWKAAEIINTFILFCNSEKNYIIQYIHVNSIREVCKNPKFQSDIFIFTAPLTQSIFSEMQSVMVDQNTFIFCNLESVHGDINTYIVCNPESVHCYINTFIFCNPEPVPNSLRDPF